MIKNFIFNNKTQSVFLFLISLVILASLISYNPHDPSLNCYTLDNSTNVLGYIGSCIADVLYKTFSIPALLIPIFCTYWSYLIFKNYIKITITTVLLKIVSMLYIITIISALFVNNISIASIILSPLLIKFSYTAYIIVGIVFFITLSIACNFTKTTYYTIINLIVNKINTLFISNIINQKKNHIKQNPIKQKTLNYNQIKIQNNNNNNNISLPKIHLLEKTTNQNSKIDSTAELKTIAEKLIQVLHEFGIKGEIIGIKQGPVVTSYEFEPAPGTKSSRIIGLADDIARSLAAISTRISVIAGRNVLGIELPNNHREFCSLRELIETQEYINSKIVLPIILGKDLYGKPFIADLAKMPHLLVAGTTGSGKSVGINTMIMSLLYRYTYQECRFIMIDPKMLELSMYNDIPHLLSPVVTDPNKAVIALKWAVKEMENRYRLMSNISVRNITSFNEKINEAIKSNIKLTHTVQTGFNPSTGEPIYESIPVDMKKLPFIVVIVDEMADLMLVAGKEIETLIQRLAQMARAAGIHIIMATQRPSVDVITGVIKANFPSRISFKVISKIDSRTILGEQGAEQLLGMGDMLYMGNSSKITRIHGPFVTDNEVSQVTEFLKSLEKPEYIDDITENKDDDNFSQLEDFNNDDDVLYKKAINIVLLEKKTSISYIQRSLRIGYNRAANIIEKMEKQKIISAPNISGKREILLKQ